MGCATQSLTLGGVPLTGTTTPPKSMEVSHTYPQMHLPTCKHTRTHTHIHTSVLSHAHASASARSHTHTHHCANFDPSTATSVLEGSARTGARRVDALKRFFKTVFSLATNRSETCGRACAFFQTVFSLAIFILMNAERRCKKARCISAASKRSEQLPQGTLERARSSRLNV